MTNSELLAKIKAEIDKLYGEYKDKFHQCGDQYHLGLIDGLDMAERVLDTLEESEKEQPDFPITNEQVKEFLATHPKVEVPQKYKTPDWIFEKSEKPIIPKDLEEAAKEYAKTSFTRPYSDTPEEVITIIEPDKCAGFIAGAKWQASHTPLPEDAVLFNNGVEEGKRLMMEEAVEGKIAERVHGKLYVRCQVPKTMGVEFGDKVRVIIVKED